MFLPILGRIRRNKPSNFYYYRVILLRFKLYLHELQKNIKYTNSKYSYSRISK